MKKNLPFSRKANFTSRLHNLILIILFSSTYILVLYGCKAMPEKDDVYENKLTSERIKIEDTGTGKNLVELYEAVNSIMDTIITDKNAKLMMLKIPMMLPDDSLKQCISYEEKMIIQGRVITCMRIISVEKLNKDYVEIP